VTDQEELTLAEATRQHHASQTAQLSTIIRGNADVLTKLGGVEQLAWETRTDVAALVQRVGDHDRRLGITESRQAARDDETTATGRHNIEKLQAELAERKRVKAERRRHYVRAGWAAAIALALTGISGGIALAFSGCSSVL